MTEAPLPPANTVEPADALQLLLQGAFALDVREPDEFAAGHVAQATLIPLGSLAGQRQALPTDRTIVVVCRSGRRSAEAVRALLASGLTNVRNLTGGLIAWRQAGLPVVEPAP